MPHNGSANFIAGRFSQTAAAVLTYAAAVAELKKCRGRGVEKVLMRPANTSWQGSS